MKFDQKNHAISLRKKGISYNKINEHVHVSKGTLSLWLRDIELTNPQKTRLLLGREKSRYAAAQIKKKERIRRTKEIIERARLEYLELIKNPLFLTGLSLYWAEGDKAQERVKFANSDEKMILFMMKWFREVCKVPENKFRVALHVHTLFTNKDIDDHWSRLTQIPKKQFYKIYIKKTSLKQRRNKLYNGTCSIVINSRELFRRIVGWKLALLDYFAISSSI